jgi:hypothetical protein
VTAPRSGHCAFRQPCSGRGVTGAPRPGRYEDRFPMGYEDLWGGRGLISAINTAMLSRGAVAVSIVAAAWIGCGRVRTAFTLARGRLGRCGGREPNLVDYRRCTSAACLAPGRSGLFVSFPEPLSPCYGFPTTTAMICAGRCQGTFSGTPGQARLRAMASGRMPANQPGWTACLHVRVGCLRYHSAQPRHCPHRTPVRPFGSTDGAEHCLTASGCSPAWVESRGGHLPR